MDLSLRVLPFNNEKNNEILLTINNNFTDQDFKYIQQLPKILSESIFLEEDYGEKFEVGNIQLEIFNTNTYEKELKTCKKQ